MLSLKCFWFRDFSLLNRKTNKYQCPYCKRYANNLYIDGIILDFIKNKNNFDVDEILIDKDHNILSYLHKSTNEFIENERSYFITGNIHHKEHFDPNKKFIINLNQNAVIGTRSFFDNRKCNVISNLGQIFEIIKDDIINNKGDKNHFSNDSICLSKNINNSIKFHKHNINKYTQSIINNSNSLNNNKKEITKIYDIIDNDQNEMNNNDLILPSFDDDESTEQSISYKKDIIFLNKKVKDFNFKNILHKNLFDENNDSDKNIIFQSKRNYNS